MQNFEVTFWDDKQEKQETVSAPTFDVAYKKFRQKNPFVIIFKIEA